MGGIAGLVRAGWEDGRLNAQLGRQLEAISHRGDAAGRHLAEGAALLALRRPTDQGGFAQGAPGLTVVADARLDSRESLAGELGKSDLTSTAADGGDARLVLEAYRRWGDGCAGHLDGDFAFAVWDAPRRSLYLARDRAGVRQLYLRRDGASVTFASELRAILAVDGLPRELNRVAVAYHLLDVMEDVEATLFEGVTRLPPAGWLRVGPEGTTGARYWAMDPGRELRLGSDAEYAEAYRAALAQSVAGRLSGPARAGVMLSGGLDSSSIAATARALRPGGEQVPVFNALLPDVGTGADAPFLEAVLAGGGFEAHRVSIETAAPLALIAPDGDDEPMRLPGLALQLGLYRAAQEAGCAAILDGDGGDDAVSHGTARLAELARAGRAGAVLREARWLRARTGAPMRSTLLAWGVRPLLPGPLLRAGRRLRGRDPWGAALPTPLNPDFVSAVDLPSRLEALCRDHAGVPHSAREEHHRLLTSGLTAHSLGVLDRAAARAGVEPRYPFLDHRLLEFCLALPSEQKLDGGWNRVVARRAMAGLLPDEVRWRGAKAVMTGGLLKGLRQSSEALEAVLEADGPLWEFADRSRTRGLYRRFLLHGEPLDGLILWLVAGVGLWLDAYDQLAQSGLATQEPHATVRS